MNKVLSFRRAFDLALQGYCVRATQWSKEYFLAFTKGELWFIGAREGPRIVPIRELAIWRQNYITWELFKE